MPSNVGVLQTAVAEVVTVKEQQRELYIDLGEGCILSCLQHLLSPLCPSFGVSGKSYLLRCANHWRQHTNGSAAPLLAQPSEAPSPILFATTPTILTKARFGINTPSFSLTSLLPR